MTAREQVDKRLSNQTVGGDAAAIRADIQRTRQALGDTLEQLQAKVKVKARIRTWIKDQREAIAARASLPATQARRTMTTRRVVAGATIAVACVGLTVIWRRTRR